MLRQSRAEQILRHSEVTRVCLQWLAKKSERSVKNWWFLFFINKRIRVLISRFGKTSLQSLAGCKGKELSTIRLLAFLSIFASKRAGYTPLCYFSQGSLKALGKPQLPPDSIQTLGFIESTGRSAAGHC